MLVLVEVVNVSGSSTRLNWNHWTYCLWSGVLDVLLLVVVLLLELVELLCLTLLGLMLVYCSRLGCSHELLVLPSTYVRGDFRQTAH